MTLQKAGDGGVDPDLFNAVIDSLNAGSGGGSTVVSSTVNYNASNFVNPVNNGAQTVALPSGVVASVFAVQVVAFAGAGNPGDEIDLVVSASVGGAFLTAAVLESGDSAPPGAPGLIEITVLAGHSPSRRVVTASACYVYAALYSAQPVTAGQMVVYAVY